MGVKAGYSFSAKTGHEGTLTTEPDLRQPTRPLVAVPIKGRDTALQVQLTNPKPNLEGERNGQLHKPLYPMRCSSLSIYDLRLLRRKEGLGGYAR
jgi:hypothetical protein